MTCRPRRQAVEERHAGAGTAGHHSFVDGIMRSSACTCNLGFYKQWSIATDRCAAQPRPQTRRHIRAAFFCVHLLTRHVHS